jgi:hypothetical protein
VAGRPELGTAVFNPATDDTAGRPRSYLAQDRAT